MEVPPSILRLYSITHYNDPAGHQDCCGRCRIRTRDLCLRSLAHYQWATTSTNEPPHLQTMSHHIYILYIYHIYQYISIYLYINICILKKEHNILRSFAKEQNFLAFFTFFAKERNILCVLLHSLQKNVTFFAFFYVLKKRMQKNASFFWVS